MNFITVLLIFLALVLALAISFYFYFYKTTFPKDKVFKQLFILRTLTFFLIALFFINPKIKKNLYTIEKPTLILAVDQSKSISYLKESENIKLAYSSLKADKKLSDKFNIQHFAFGDKIRATDTLKFDDNQTIIYDAIDHLNKLNSKNSALIILSDGNQTNGNDYQYFKAKFPIYTLVAGDTALYADLKINQLNLNDFTFTGNHFPVEAFLQYDGKGAVNTTFKVTENGKLLYSQTLELSENHKSQTLNFQLESGKAGVHQFTATLTPFKNEKNSLNNQKYFSINTLINQSDILIISSFNHPDLGALKRSIESNKQNKVTAYIGDGKLLNLKKYQLVITYQPNASQKLFFENLQKEKIPNFIITGSETDWNFLNTVQQVFHKNSNEQTENYFPNLNNTFEPFIVDGLDFESFPPLLSNIGQLNFSIKPQILLYSKANNSKAQEVLMATYTQNNRRGAVLFGNDFWKWRMASFNKNQNFDAFDKLMNNLVLYLAEYQSKRQIKADYKAVLYANQPAIFKAQFFDETNNFDKRGQLDIQITDEHSKKTTIFPLVLSENQYAISLNELLAGNYNFKIKERQSGVFIEGKFVLLNFPIEQQFSNADYGRLKNLSSNNHGDAYLLKNYKLLSSKLASENEFKSIEKRTTSTRNFIDFKWLFLLVIASASAEWFIRKYRGLI
ncbi:MAG: hypothetical protein GW847_00075 [Zetaproteobacteria bacterium]|nr:hypothetical protein [Zetaproteobacteria bacterium]